ncbi:hypothetical protein Pvag_pPag20134 (plasmid) [Pantoea vagans C9-1]|nr:hypothetical protein Pvag_pPag20134 [Pantoea vagans C9-1]
MYRSYALILWIKIQALKQKALAEMPVSRNTA